MKLITIDGTTRSVKSWSRAPGSAKYLTIITRLLRGSDPESAVFGGDGRGKSQTGKRHPPHKLMRKAYKKAQKFDCTKASQWGSVVSITFRVPVEQGA